jgi:hypothetical protein
MNKYLKIPDNVWEEITDFAAQFAFNALIIIATFLVCMYFAYILFGLTLAYFLKDFIKKH